MAGERDVLDRTMAERVLSLVRDPEWLAKADLDVWERVVRNVRAALQPEGSAGT